MKLLAIVGPTAAGKTRMSVEVATALAQLGHSIEIVSCDSMAVYRGLDIAADKPPMSERGGIEHHLLDIADPDEEITAVAYREIARNKIAEITERGGVAMLVGGSGLWFRAVVDDLEFAPTQAELRRHLETQDPGELYARLAEADPEAAARIDVRNIRRVVRAVEILELTGRPPSELRSSWGVREGPYDLCAAGLMWARDELYGRATQRVQRELDAGLVDEVREALERGLSRTARQALGVKEIAEHLETGITLEEAKTTLIRNTKNFVRKQLSWFRADPRVEWVDATELGWDGARETIVERSLVALG